jgi:nitric oxide reductase large subunit
MLMPFTPFHLGINASISFPLRKYIDVPIFILVNVAIDIEPLIVLSYNLTYPVHGYYHTLMFGSIVGIVFSLFAYQSRNVVHKVMDFFYFPYETTYKKILLSSLLGVWFHILLDSPLYTDIQPFYPLQMNPLYNVISTWTIYLLCIVSFIPALLMWKGIFVSEYKRRHGTNISNRLKMISSITWKVLIIGVCIVSLLFLFMYLMSELSSSDYTNNIKFDSNQWQDEELIYSDRYVRIKMIDDLLRSN